MALMGGGPDNRLNLVILGERKAGSATPREHHEHVHVLGDIHSETLTRSSSREVRI